MQETTLKSIEMLAKADNEVSSEQLQAIVRACKKTITKRKLINAREVMEMLEISRPTLKRMCRAGKLTEIQPTPRKTRFDLAEIESIMYQEKLA